MTSDVCEIDLDMQMSFVNAASWVFVCLFVCLFLSDPMEGSPDDSRGGYVSVLCTTGGQIFV